MRYEVGPDFVPHTSDFLTRSSRSFLLHFLGSGLLAALGGLRAVLLGEPLHAAFGVDQLLLAREERVAARADFEMQLGLCRMRLPRGAAGAARLDLVVLRVNAFLHSALLGTTGKHSL